MNGFIVLLLTVGVALAAPQYNYQPAQVPSYQQAPVAAYQPAQTYQPAPTYQAAPISSNNGGFAPSFGGIASSAPAQPVSHVHSSHQPIVSKQFFIHAAPEEQEEGGADKVINLGPARKNYRVVFIKAPNAAVNGGRIRFQAPANEEKTVIYVLSRKTDLADIAADVQQAQPQQSKPEVHFIKYKTPEEAQHAQRTIQAQYDQLGGTSQISDEGVAPVQSVIGVLGDNNAPSSQQIAASNPPSAIGGGFGSTGAGISSIGGSSNGYLPPSK